ncbi:MAG TPA: hypothetical protein VEK08_10710 [Planctomycetota bacterium]|nr:hypothetical protein [Planctomycetota bacterium]
MKLKLKLTDLGISNEEADKIKRLCIEDVRREREKSKAAKAAARKGDARKPETDKKREGVS